MKKITSNLFFSFLAFLFLVVLTPVSAKNFPISDPISSTKITLPAAEITISGDSSPICLGATITLTLSGVISGNINKWERQVNNGGYNNIANSNGNLTITDTPTYSGTYQYRVTLKNGSLTEFYYTHSIVVNTPPNGGGVYGGNSNICNNGSTGIMTLSGSTGTILDWEKRLNSGTWNSIANTTNNYSEIPSSPGTWEYRCLVGIDGCTTVYSTPFTVVVNPTLTITLGANPVICATTTSTSIPYTATTGNPNQWFLVFDSNAHSAGLLDQNSPLNTTPGSIAINVPYSISAGIYNATVTVLTYSPSCSSISYPVSITINPSSLGGNVSSNQTICSGNSPANITTSCQTGTTIQWQTSTDNSTFTPISGATTTTLTSAQMGVLTVTHYYRVNSGSTNSNSVKMTVTPSNTITRTSAIGTDSQTTCINSGITTITYATVGATGTIITGLPTGVTGTSSANVVTLSGTPTSSGTFNYLITLTGGCGSTTATGKITVNSTPGGGSITGGNTPICNTVSTGTMTLTGSTGTILGWEKRLNSGTWTSIANTTNTYSETPTPTGTWDYRGVIGNGGCTTVYSTPFTVVVNPNLPVSVTIGASATTICSGTSVTFTATPTNGGTTPSYQWKVNGTVVGSNSATYNSTTLTNGNTVSVVMTSNATPCSIGSPATSNNVTIIVNPNLPSSVTIGASATTICSGTSVTFTATPTNGGTTPTYQWKVNGVNAGTNSASFTSTALVNSDIISLIMTSSASPCLTGSPATSNGITMTVNPNLPASVSITASATTICSGTSVTFTATPTNGGTTPTYQWKVNGVNAGTNSASFTSTALVNSNIVSVVMTSNASPCLTGSPATSNGITMTVNPNLPASVTIGASATTICSGTSVTFTATPTNGGTTPTYQWKVNGVNAGTNSASFTSTALVNSDIVSVVMTSNATPCSTGSPATSNNVTMTVNLLPTASVVYNNSPICIGTDASFTLNGTSGALVTYTINGGTTSTTILNGGTALITVLQASTSQTLNLVSVASNGCTTALGTSSVVGFDATMYDGSTWSNGLPTSTKSAIFTGNYSIAANFNACSILVTNNAAVEVNSNNNVYLQGTITVATGSSFTLSNNTNLIQADESAVNIGNIIVKRNTSTIVRLDHTLWSSPVVGQNLYSFSPATLSTRFYTYDTTLNAYVTTGLSSSSVFTPAKGFAIRAPNDQSATTPAEWTGVFTGVPNNGTKYFAVTYDSNGSNYNLVGNPYPSTIDANTFYQENQGVIEGTLYFYQHTLSMNALGYFPESGTNYASWTPGTGGAAATTGDDNHTPAVAPNGTIQVGQGFIVGAIAPGNVTFTNSMRAADQRKQFLRTKNVPAEKNRIWLNLKSSTGADINQILVGYVTGATQGVDANCDGLLYGNTGSYLYSTINGDYYVIQGRALPFTASDEVQLGFNCATAGNYSIKLADMDGLFLGSQDVYIRDNLKGTDTNIKTAPYVFSSEIGTFENRFQIVYTQALGIPSNDFNEKSVIVYKGVDGFHVTTKGNSMKTILVYDVSGRLIFKLNDINATTAILKGLSQTNEVLLLKIISEENKSVTIKIIN